MARRRSSYRTLATRGGAIAVIAAAIVAVWLWPKGRSSSQEGSDNQLPPPMSATVNADANKPALRLIVPPTGDTSLDKSETPTGRGPDRRTPEVERLVAPATQPASSRPAGIPDVARADADLRAGLAAIERDELLAARNQLNRALHKGLAADQAEVARDALANLADKTILGSTVLKDDPLAEYYVVRAGDKLGKIAEQFKVSEGLLARINALPDKNFIREGKRLKVVHGPFHAAIDKSEHLLHVYLQDVYVRTFRVALGTDGSTPTGKWKVLNHQENPGWTDPRTGKRWHPDDPQNPIGEHWIGLEGVEGEAVGQIGYGIHGTIEPQTIGQNVSMGCVRLAPDDIVIVYQLLVPGESFVTISD